MLTLQECLTQFDSEILACFYTMASKEFLSEIDKVLMLPMSLMMLIMNFSSSSSLFLMIVHCLSHMYFFDM